MSSRLPYFHPEAGGRVMRSNFFYLNGAEKTFALLNKRMVWGWALKYLRRFGFKTFFILAILLLLFFLILHFYLSAQKKEWTYALAAVMALGLFIANILDRLYQLKREDSKVVIGPDIDV